MERLEHFYKIDQLLKDRKAVSFSTLRSSLGVSAATLKRDLEYMRERPPRADRVRPRDERLPLRKAALGSPLRSTRRARPTSAAPRKWSSSTTTSAARSSPSR